MLKPFIIHSLADKAGKFIERGLNFQHLNATHIVAFVHYLRSAI